MDITGDPTVNLGIWIVLLAFSASFHESAHAWVAYLCGDDTAKNDGRVSLNPMVHISLMDTILMPAFLLWATHGQFVLGGAKPVPIFPHKLRNPERDLALATLAGPVSNLVIVVGATVLLLLGKIILRPILSPEIFGFLYGVLEALIFLNLVLAFFNLLPIPPLDGSRIVRYLFPPLRDAFDVLDQWGLLVLIFLLYAFPEVARFIFEVVVWSLAQILYLYRMI